MGGVLFIVREKEKEKKGATNPLSDQRTGGRETRCLKKQKKGAKTPRSKIPDQGIKAKVQIATDETKKVL